MPQSAQRILILIVAALAGSAARADLVSIGSAGSISMSPGGSSANIVIPVFNASGTPANLIGWSLGLRVVPVGTVQGSVSVDTSSITYLPSHIISQNSFPLLTLNQPQPGDVQIGAAGAFGDSFAVSNQAAGQTFVSFRLNATANASGSFALQLVNNGTNTNTYWNDASTFQERSLIVNGSSFSSGTAEIGQIEVFAAVPEPSSLLLTAAVAGIFGWRARRRRGTEGTTFVPAAAENPAADVG